jgi:hypothetical protein
VPTKIKGSFKQIFFVIFFKLGVVSVLFAISKSRPNLFFLWVMNNFFCGDTCIFWITTIIANDKRVAMKISIKKQYNNTHIYAAL